MKALTDTFDEFETQRKRMEVHAGDEAVFESIQSQFATQNLEIVHSDSTVPTGKGYVIVKTADGEYLGTVGMKQLQMLISPEIHRVGRARNESFTEILDLLEQTVFKLTERHSLLAVSREIEDRAWRCNTGSLYAGFQRAAAFNKQAPLYNRLQIERDLSVRVFVQDGWNASADDAVTVVSSESDEIGRFWFVLYDGGEDPMQASGLIAEEREPDSYYGFWSYDPALIGDVIDYLEATYSSRLHS